MTAFKSHHVDTSAIYLTSLLLSTSQHAGRRVGKREDTAERLSNLLSTAQHRLSLGRQKTRTIHSMHASIKQTGTLSA